MDWVLWLVNWHWVGSSRCFHCSSRSSSSIMIDWLFGSLVDGVIDWSVVWLLIRSFDWSSSMDSEVDMLMCNVVNQTYPNLTSNVNFGMNNQPMNTEGTANGRAGPQSICNAISYKNNDWCNGRWCRKSREWHRLITTCIQIDCSQHVRQWYWFLVWCRSTLYGLIDDTVSPNEWWWYVVWYRDNDDSDESYS